MYFLTFLCPSLTNDIINVWLSTGHVTFPSHSQYLEETKFHSICAPKSKIKNIFPRIDMDQLVIQNDQHPLLTLLPFMICLLGHLNFVLTSETCALHSVQFVVNVSSSCSTYNSWHLQILETRVRHVPSQRAKHGIFFANFENQSQITHV